jgi:transcriptional regulator with XRE-family HTH domain
VDDTSGTAPHRPVADWPQVLERVPGRLRDLRHRRDLTLAQVAEATGIHVSTLSRLESGARRPGLDLLLPLAEVYGVPLDHFVGAAPGGAPRVHPRPVRIEDMVYIPLSRRGGGTQAYKLILPGRDSGRRMRLRTPTTGPNGCACSPVR